MKAVIPHEVEKLEELFCAAIVEAELYGMKRIKRLSLLKKIRGHFGSSLAIDGLKRYVSYAPRINAVYIRKKKLFYTINNKRR